MPRRHFCPILFFSHPIGPLNDVQRDRSQSTGGEFPEGNKPRLRGVGPRQEGAPPAAAEEIDQDIMIGHSFIRFPKNPFQYFYQSQNFHFQMRLLVDFPDEGLLQRLAQVHTSPRDGPLPEGRFPSPFYQENFLLFKNDGSDSDDRSIRIFSLQSPSSVQKWIFKPRICIEIGFDFNYIK
jgi:hypothetical protein